MLAIDLAHNIAPYRAGARRVDIRLDPIAKQSAGALPRPSARQKKEVQRGPTLVRQVLDRAKP